MKKEISLTDVRKHAGNIVLIPIFYTSLLIGIGSIALVLILVEAIHFDASKHIWPLIMLSLSVGGALVIGPIAMLIGRRSKALQKRYVLGLIRNKNQYVKVLKMYSEEFANNAFQEAEELFKDLNQSFEAEMEGKDAEQQIVEKAVFEKLKLGWAKVKKMIEQAPDEETKKDLKESYRTYKRELLGLIPQTKSVFEGRKNDTMEEYQQRIERIMTAREQVIIERSQYYEQRAEETKAEAKEWQVFFERNY